MEHPSKLLNQLPHSLLIIFVSVLGGMIKCFAHAGEVDRVRDLRKQMTSRGLQFGPVTVGCMGEAW